LQQLGKVITSITTGFTGDIAIAIVPMVNKTIYNRGTTVEVFSKGFEAT
jgi:hypothetical protein